MKIIIDTTTAFDDWLAGVNDRKGKAAITTRLLTAESGLLRGAS